MPGVRDKTHTPNVGRSFGSRRCHSSSKKLFESGHGVVEKIVTDSIGEWGIFDVNGKCKLNGEDIGNGRAQRIALRLILTSGAPGAFVFPARLAG